MYGWLCQSRRLEPALAAFICVLVWRRCFLSFCTGECGIVTGLAQKKKSEG